MDLFIDLPVRTINTSCFNNEHFIEFVEEMKHMKYLEEVIIDQVSIFVLFPYDLKALCELPSHIKIYFEKISYLDINRLDINRCNLKECVAILHNMKQLVTLNIVDFYNYKLKSSELRLFCGQ